MLKVQQRKTFFRRTCPFICVASMISFRNNIRIFHLRNRGPETPVKLFPDNSPGIITTKGNIQPSRMERNPTCHVNKILNHSTKPTSCGLLAVNGPVRQIAVILTKTFLPAEAQQIVGQQSQRHYVGVGGKMLAWKSFQSHVSLYLRMKLLGGAVVMVMKDGMESIIIERRPV